ncbi:MAG: hypothetical protein WB497_24525, partial [Pseudolabrys sp.]
LQEQARKRGEAVNKVKLPAWVNHDLRRTLRSHLSELRVSSDVAEAILAHVKPGIRGVYDPYEYFDEKRDALELWAAHIKTLTGSKSVSAKAAPREEVGNDKPRASFAERSAWLARTRQ